MIVSFQHHGTLTAIFGNLGRSYYGVDNSAHGANLALRAGQVMDLLRGTTFGILASPTRNALAPWALLVLLVAARVAMLDVRPVRPPHRPDARRSARLAVSRCCRWPSWP